MDPSKRNQEDRMQIPAAFAFDGPAYKGLDVQSCSPQSLQYLQSNLRIIDALYGCLRPLDLIQPYRLEMATSGILKDLNKGQHQHKSLASYWSPSITESISMDLRNKVVSGNGRYLINLASDEYATAVNTADFPDDTKCIKIVFQEQGRVVAVHAKRARGLMVRYIADNLITNVDDVKKFDVEGYTFVEERSDETVFTFDRLKSSTKTKKRKGNDSSSSSTFSSKVKTKK